MIDSISSSSSNMYSSSSSSSRSSNSLSYSQEETLESVLANYDSSSLSSEDASEIVSAFKEAGIQASKELANSMASLGFDAQMVGELAGVQGPKGGGGMPPPPPPPREEEESISDILSELLSSSEEDDEYSLSSSSNTYLNNSNDSFESILDYTSRILSLNDEAKDKVMDLFENYKSDNTELKSNEVSNIIKNSLGDILNDENNYKSTSFYA